MDGEALVGDGAREPNVVVELADGSVAPDAIVLVARAHALAADAASRWGQLVVGVGRELVAHRAADVASKWGRLVAADGAPVEDGDPWVAADQPRVSD